LADVSEGVFVKDLEARLVEDGELLLSALEYYAPNGEALKAAHRLIFLVRELQAEKQALTVLVRDERNSFKASLRKFFAAEAREKKLREALEKIADERWNEDENGSAELRGIAHTALKGES